jgi:hypothetical protein
MAFKSLEEVSGGGALVCVGLVWNRCSRLLGEGVKKMFTNSTDPNRRQPTDQPPVPGVPRGVPAVRLRQAGAPRAAAPRVPGPGRLPGGGGCLIPSITAIPCLYDCTVPTIDAAAHPAG